ncbi:MAG TPA: XamI family restriction endonuclease [Phycisphaerae bacterium]|nr:XamI family restriction endonuclease [Phycisphaerae bacterium]
MPINLDKPQRWKADIAASVDLFNAWFLRFAPKAYRDTRVKTTKDVQAALTRTNDLAEISATLLQTHPTILATLRMATCPPIACDRLIGLAAANKHLVLVMKEGLPKTPDVHLPPRMKPPELRANLARIAKTIRKLLDIDIFPWLERDNPPTNEERLICFNQSETFRRVG